MISRKLISVFISILLLCVSYAGVYAQNDNLAAIGITQNSLTGVADGFISRAEFSYLISKILSEQDMQPVNTKFIDVDEKNVYSGYIAYLNSQGIVNGVSETEFAPDAFVTIWAASKIIVNVLGFNTYGINQGGYPDGYLYVATKLGIFKDVYVSGEFITRKEALQMLENTLLAINGSKAFPFIQENENFDVPDKDENIYLTTHIGYSVYRGIIRSVNVKNNSMRFYVEKNMYETNHTLLTEKTEITLNVSEKIDLAHYDRVPVDIWTNSEGYVTLIRVRNGYSVEYGVVETVNGDSVLSSPYESRKVERMTIVGRNEEFSLSSDTNFYYNGKLAESGVDLSDCFCRMVVKGEEVLDIFCYKTENGGLIKNISAGEKLISYVSENGLLKKWDKAIDSEQLLVFIDGRVADFNEIKTGSVFNYYNSDALSVIVVSERTAFDVFSSYSQTYITLGAFSYQTDNCLFSKDGKTYKTGEVVYELLDNEVQAYFAPNGKVSFVEKSTGESKLERFYGVVSGINEPNGLENDSKIELYKVDEIVEKAVYTITKKTTYKDGLNLSALAANAKNTNGEGIYYFTANGKGEITEIEECTPFTGYGAEAKWSGTAFTNEILPVVTMPNNKQLYFDGTTIIGIYEENNEFVVSKINWTSVYGRSVGGTATLEFFSRDEAAQPEIAVLCGAINNMPQTENAYGVVTKKFYALNDDEDTVNTVEIMASNGTRTYYVSDEVFERLSVNDFISFAQRLTNTKDQLIVSEIIDMSGDIDEWKVSLTTGAGLQRGVVRNIDSKRLYIESDSPDDVYFMHPYACYVLKAVSNKNQKFSAITISDISIGDKVCYYLRDGEIRVIIVQE